MAGTIIDTTSSVGLKLTTPGQNPVTVTATGTIVTSGNYAIEDNTGTPGNIVNHGLLESTPGSGTGVIMVAARSVLSNYGVITAGGSGVYMVGGRANVTNLGSIAGMATTGDGVALGAGGTITNGSSSAITATLYGGEDGILSEALGATIQNDGTITGRAGNGIKLESGNGTIANGAGGQISGAEYGVVINAAGSVTNAGTITGQTGAGLYIGGTGHVSNGSSLAAKTSIRGASYGIFTGGKTSTISNFGTADATANSGIGVCLSHGGTLQNGAAGVAGALIHGGLDGVVVHSYGAKIANYGTISAGDGVGVRIESSTGAATIINGSGAGSASVIAGNSYGITVAGSATVTNDGTISAIGGGAIYIAGSGTVNNGNASEIGRNIHAGRYGIFVGGSGIVHNFGTISGTNSGGDGVRLNGGGTIANGSAGVKGAVITGGGIGLVGNAGNASITNFGTITGTSLEGISLASTGGTDSLTNAAGAVIKGRTGVIFGDAGTLTNAGTITGTAGTAVSLGGSSDTLIVDAGAVFNGTVTGGGGALDFAAGTGTVAQIGTKYTGFGTVTFASGGTWTLTGGNSAGSLANDGTVTLAGSSSLDVTSAVDTGSTGVFQLSAGSTLEIAADTGTQDSMRFLAGADLVIDSASLFGSLVGTSSYSGPLIENFVAGDMIDLKNVDFSGAEFKYTASSGVLQISNGGSAVASLAFQTSTLGTGGFHLGNDSGGHLLITHS